MPKRIQNPKITEALQKAFGFKGRYTPQLDELVVPTYIIQDPAPSYATRQASISISRITDGILANQLLHVVLQNPVGSGVVGLVTQMSLQFLIQDVGPVSTGDTVFVGVHLGTFVGGAPQIAGFRDTREPGDPLLVGIVERDLIAQVAPFIFRAAIPAGVETATSVLQGFAADPRQSISVLIPGSYLEVSTAVGPDNPLDIEVLLANFHWLEIPEATAVGVGTPP